MLTEFPLNDEWKSDRRAKGLFGKDMLTRIPLDAEWTSHVVRGIFGATRWNQYRSNWPVVLDVLRQLWEAGKVSELKSPFYEPVEKPVKY
jgi:hypothetical protein